MLIGDKYYASEDDVLEYDPVSICGHVRTMCRRRTSGLPWAVGCLRSRTLGAVMFILQEPAGFLSRGNDIVQLEMMSHRTVTVQVQYSSSTPRVRPASRVRALSTFL